MGPWMMGKHQFWEDWSKEGCRQREEQVIRFGGGARASQGKRGRWEVGGKDTPGRRNCTTCHAWNVSEPGGVSTTISYESSDSMPPWSPQPCNPGSPLTGQGTQPFGPAEGGAVAVTLLSVGKENKLWVRKGVPPHQWGLQGSLTS